MEAAHRGSRVIPIGLLLLGLMAVLAVFYPGTEPASPGPAFPVTAAPGPIQGPTPVAWQYDAENDRHWDPGHAHWHSGPPPDPSQR